MFWNSKLEDLQNYLNSVGDTITILPFFNPSSMPHEKFTWMHSFFVANILIEQDGGATDPNIIINETMTLVNSLNETSLFYNPKIDVIIGFLATHGFIIDAEPYQEMVADALEEFVQCS